MNYFLTEHFIAKYLEQNFFHCGLQHGPIINHSTQF